MRITGKSAAVILLLWFFFRFDPDDGGAMVIDGGHAEPDLCEAHAASYGYLTRPLSTRIVYGPDGKITGRWQRACFDGPAALLATRRPYFSTVNILR